MSPAISLRPRFLSAYGFSERMRRNLFARRSPRRSIPRGRALDESAAEHARLSRRRVVEHAGLARRNALFAGNEFDFVSTVHGAQPGRLRRARRAHAHEHLDTVADDALQRAGAD